MFENTSSDAFGSILGSNKVIRMGEIYDIHSEFEKSCG